MNNILVGLYALYFFFTAYKGNSAKAMADIQRDAPGFMPWMLSIIVLSLLYNNEKTRKITEPFIFLIVVSFVLKNFTQIKTEVQTIYQGAVGSTSTHTTVA